MAPPLARTCPVHGQGDRTDQDSPPGDLTVVRATAPLSELTRCAAQLGGMTQGQGAYTMELGHYEQVPAAVQAAVVAKAAGPDADDE